MLFTKPITDVFWNDVEVFCQHQISEGSHLDYKEDFPTQLEKTISAMANTLGGVIIIGVEEDNNNRPVLPLKGIDFRRGLSERVTSIILTNISPPVFPEIQVCKNKTGNKAVVVIRVPQSHQTPHAISKNTRVYLRTRDINKPEELATIEQITWLTDHRQNSIALRENLYQQAKRRYEAFADRVILKIISQGNNVPEVHKNQLTVIACPTYPHAEYQDPSELLGLYENICVHDYYGSGGGFPPRNRFSESGIGTIVQDGVVFVSYANIGERIFYTEINTRGMFYYRQTIKRESTSFHDIPGVLLSGEEILARIDEFLESAYRYYHEIGYWGYIDLSISLDNIQEQGLCLDWLKSAHSDVLMGFCPDSEVTFTRTFLAGNLDIEKEKLLFESMQRLSWGFNIVFDPVYLESFYNKFKRQ